MKNHLLVQVLVTHIKKIAHFSEEQSKYDLIESVLNERITY